MESWLQEIADYEDHARTKLEFYRRSMLVMRRRGYGGADFIRIPKGRGDECAHFRPILSTLKKSIDDNSGLSCLTYYDGDEKVDLLGGQVRRLTAIGICGCYLYDVRVLRRNDEKVTAITELLRTLGLLANEIELSLLTTALVARFPAHRVLDIADYYLRLGPIVTNPRQHVGARTVEIVEWCLGNEVGNR